MPTLLPIVASYLLQALVIARVLIRKDREPAARIAWITVVAAVPFLGIALYLLFGEVSIGRRALARMEEAIRSLPPDGRPETPPHIPERIDSVFDRMASINGFHPVGGNAVTLADDSDDAISRLVADIDAARDHVHLLFYIWLADGNGLRVVEAVRRAAARGVSCRVLVDAHGSRGLVASSHWREMRAAGAEARVAFPTSWPFLRMFIARVDIRDHRKIAVIDGAIAHFGSQNCADAAFRVKPRYAPWVDVFFRAEGPVARQFQLIFAADWRTHAGEDLTSLLIGPLPAPSGEAVAVACGTGPRINPHAVSDCFQLAVAVADGEVTISTPYYVPNEALQDQICSAAMRGVRVRMLFPARNDSRIVAWASRSYYESLLEAGVEIYEYHPGLLHAKTVVIDGHAALVGSANMDRRSFELNFENNVFISDATLAAAIRARQEVWLADCDRVTLEAVKAWSIPRRLLYSLTATMGPLL